MNRWEKAAETRRRNEAKLPARELRYRRRLAAEKGWKTRRKDEYARNRARRWGGLVSPKGDNDE